LLVAAAKPEAVLPKLLKAGDILAYQAEDTSEEQDVESAVRSGIQNSIKVLTHYGHTLYHRDDLGFNLEETLPIPFGKFKFGVCDSAAVREEFAVPTRGDMPPPPPSCSFEESIELVPNDVGAIVKVMGCGSVPLLEDPQQAPAIVWTGGEKAALARLDAYMHATGLGTYHRTRNQIQGASTSSKLSPWLANGCLSPRTVYWAAKAFERSQKASNKKSDGFDHVYKFIFELNWRDYFRFYCAHFGKRVFFLGGPAKRKHDWRRDSHIESRWRTGSTGAPLVDALMRELVATGYIANRGRYIVACYLVHYLGIDWRVGADWFERWLLDHDVCSNYGEWASMANVAAAPTRGQPLGLKGRGPTKSSSTGSNGSAGDPWKQGADIGFAIFDPWEQGKQYDKTETYVRRWVPEMRLAPDGFAHRPHLLDDAQKLEAGCSDYPASPLSLQPFSYRSLSKDTYNGVTSCAGAASSTATSATVGQRRQEWRREEGPYSSKSVSTRPTGRRWQAKKLRY
jgi:deoxyribodipyrimidine photo-lyase